MLYHADMINRLPKRGPNFPVLAQGTGIAPGLLRGLHRHAIPAMNIGLRVADSGLSGNAAAPEFPARSDPSWHAPTRPKKCHPTIETKRRIGTSKHGCPNHAGLQVSASVPIVHLARKPPRPPPTHARAVSVCGHTSEASKLPPSPAPSFWAKRGGRRTRGTPERNWSACRRPASKRGDSDANQAKDAEYHTEGNTAGKIPHTLTHRDDCI